MSNAGLPPTPLPPRPVSPVSGAVNDDAAQTGIEGMQHRGNQAA